MKGADMSNGTADTVYVKRFSLYRIIEHWLVATLFVVLAATGLSQKFYASDFSRWFVVAVGGIDTVRIIHRICGAVFAGLIAQHVVIASWGVLFRKWEPSILINRKDFLDAADNLKYYFGLTNQPARCARYDYKQKFEYWGILAGGLMMIVTGLTLWFPVFVARFLPGSVIPAAKALHTNMAMMIFFIVAVWHIYNSIFSPEVFPIDTVIFTGRISKRRMMKEHPLEYEKMFGTSAELLDSDVPQREEMRQERGQESG
jgi:formate dehydrogenase subunit gamma